jgi:hypothetical protein
LLIKNINMILTSPSNAALASLLFLASAQADDTVRFEKFNFTEPASKTINFPLDQADADFLRQNSNSISVSLVDDECSAKTDIAQVKADLSEVNLYPPTFPEDEGFWDEFAVVVKAMEQLKTYQKNPCMTDPLPLVMPRVTDQWKGFSIVDVAEAVHDEFPGIYHTKMIANWLETGGITFSNDAIPRLSETAPDFNRGPIMLADMIGRGVRLVGPCNFCLKWEAGMPRPEEIAFAVDQGTLPIPQHIGQKRAKRLKDTLRDFNMKDPTDFTAYAEGSPTHPSWPAMHSAAASASFWLDVVMDLTPEQLCEARMLDYSVSFARTVAGVHYEGDNFSGLMVGQSILAQRLPAVLADEYGSDMAKVQARIDAKRYDWTTFEDSDCFKQDRFKSVPAAKPESCAVGGGGGSGGGGSGGGGNKKPGKPNKLRRRI